VEAEAKLRSVRRRFGVSLEIIGWQALRSGASFRSAVRDALLDQLPADRRIQLER
jgi:hypothetical protein